MADQDNDSRDDDKPSRPQLRVPPRDDNTWDTGTRSGPRARKVIERARESEPPRPPAAERRPDGERRPDDRYARNDRPPPRGDDRYPRRDDRGQRDDRAPYQGRNTDRPTDDRPPYQPRGDRPAYQDRGERPPFRPREDRPYQERSERPAGDRPFHERSDRPAGDRPPYQPRGDRPAYQDRGERPPFRPREDRPFQDRGDRPFHERGDRPAGDRPPYQPRGDRPAYQERGERPPFRPREDRPFQDRGDRPAGDRPFRERDDRPTYQDRGERPPFRPREDRPFQDRGDRPFRERDDRPAGDRPPYQPRGDRPAYQERGERPPFRPREDRPFQDRSERPAGDRPFRERDDRPAYQDRGERAPFRPREDRPFQDRGDRPAGDRPFRERGDRPAYPDRGERAPFRPREDRPFQDRSERPAGDRPFRERGDRPAYQDRGERPPFRPRDDRPYQSRDDRPRFDRDNRGERPAPARPPAATGDLATGIARWFSPCPRGLEPVLRDELHKLEAGEIRIVPGGVQFTGDHRLGMRVNLESRIASRVLRAIETGTYRDEHDLNRIAGGIDWAGWFSPDVTIKVELVAQRSPLRSLEFTTLKIKDAICDRFRNETGRRPSIDTATPDVRISVFCDESNAIFYLDTSGEALFKRGWRLEKVAAPLRENLAAGLLALSGWTPAEPLIDPFCGSGTIPIEAAHIAFGRAPGLEREFAFRHLAGFDGTVWDALLAEARARINDETEARIYGSDISIAALPAAKSNAERAGVDIEWRQIDARLVEPPTPEPGLLICNPPYGERIHVRGRQTDEVNDDDRAFFEDFGRALKERFVGWRVAILSSDPNLAGKLRLKPARSLALFNGALACKLHVFEIRAESGEEFDREEAKALRNRVVYDEEADLAFIEPEAESTAAEPTPEPSAPHATDIDSSSADDASDVVATSLPADPPQSPADVDADAGLPPAGADADADVVSDPTPAGPEAGDKV